MPFTREQIGDMKTIIKETISELLTDDKFIAAIADKVGQKLKLKETQDKVIELNKTVETLKNINNRIKNDIEYLQQHIKRKSIRIQGVPENEENVQDKVISILKEKLKLNIKTQDFENCFRIGKTINGKRSILVTVTELNKKIELLRNRKLLKGTGITITEDMTSGKYKLLKMATEKLGKGKVWYYGGNIKAKIGQEKYTIRTIADLEKIN